MNKTEKYILIFASVLLSLDIAFIVWIVNTELFLITVTSPDTTTFSDAAPFWHIAAGVAMLIAFTAFAILITINFSKDDRR